MDNRIVRLNEVITNHLVSEKSKLEAELERILNKDMDTDSKVKTIDDILKRIADNNQKLVHWKAYIKLPEPKKNENNE